MKFLFAANTPRDPNAGASGADICTIEALRASGHHVDEIWADDMPRVIRHPNLHQLLELPRRFASIIGKRCNNSIYDVVQVNQPHAWLAAKQHRLLNRHGIFINRSHGWETSLHQALDRLQLRDDRSFIRRFASGSLRLQLEKHNKLAAQWSDGIVVCSESDRQFVTRVHGVDTKRIHAFLPGLPAEYVETAITQSEERWRRVLYIGNFCRPKAPEIVAEVFRGIAKSSVPAELTWVCAERDHTAVRCLLGEASSAVSLRGFTSREELRQLYDHHGVFIFPSHFEGFGLVFLEAMSRGMCVIATAVGGVPSIITTHVNGVITPFNEPERTLKQVLHLLECPDIARSMGICARQQAAACTWEAASGRYAAFCATVAQFKSNKSVGLR